MEQVSGNSPSARAVELGKTGDGAALPELIGLLVAPAPNVRRLAASAVGKLAGVADAAQAVAALQPLLRDPHPQVRQYVVKALGAYRAAATSALDVLRGMAAAPGETEYNRRAAVAALAAIGGAGGKHTTYTTDRTDSAGAGGKHTTYTTDRTDSAGAEDGVPVRAARASPPARAYTSYASYPSYSSQAQAVAAALDACPAAVRGRLVAALSDVAGLSPADAVATLRVALQQAPTARDAAPRSARAVANTDANPGIIPPHGGYEALESYRTSEIIHDGTVVFCRRFVPPRSRTYDQMVQAARSGKQNQVEGSVDSATSKKLELKLVGTARGSLEELLRDCTDYLRQHGLALWDKNDPRALAVRRLAYVEDRTYTTYRTHIEDGTAEEAANTLICLIHQANFLLDRQTKTLEKAFLDEGGFTERLYRVRKAHRSGAPPPDA